MSRFATQADRLQRRLAEHPRARLLRRWYHRHEHLGPLVFFFGGVIWDAATLRRIDAWFDNLFLLGYLVALGVLVVLTLLDREERLTAPRLRALRGWFAPGIQFFAGALFSAYVIYYVQSATWSTSFFVLFLVGLLVANEFIWQRALNVYLLVGIYHLAVLSFFIFFLPVVFGAMGYGMFALSGLISLAVVGGILYYLKRRVALYGTQLMLAGILVGLQLGVVHLFYAQNWIPPVPLALRAGSVAHHVEPAQGAYELTYEPAPWYAVWRRADATFHATPQDTVFCFAAVFAPTTLDAPIVHRWQRYDPQQKTWRTTDRIRYEVQGGRRGGYRGYTFKRHVTPGRWRVDVETLDGLVIGRIGFRVVGIDSSYAVPLRTVRYE